jgi:alanyl-tRNA synthetase
MATRRLYYDDSFQREFTARVLSCDPATVSPSRGDRASTWQAILDQTVFYPTSGGQPHDLGKIGDAQVLEVCDREEQIVHVVDRRLECVEVKGLIDWPRRFDHMQQHTGQHLLSAVFQKHFGLPTISFHLGTDVCTIDLRGPEPSQQILEDSERAANEMIFEDRGVSVRYGTAEELSRLGVRKEVDRQGVLRAIEIAGVELQPCGGTHLKSTGQVGMILVRRCTKIRQDWRVEFVCGGRAEERARRDFRALREAAEKLSCAPEEVVSAVGRALAERDANFKNYRELLERLAAAEAALALQSTPSDSGSLRVIDRVFSGVTPEFLGLFAGELAKRENTIALLGRMECGHIFFAQHPSSGKDMNALIREVLEKLGGKGGGTRDFARGKVADSSHLEEALVLAREKLSGGS